MHTRSSSSRHANQPVRPMPAVRSAPPDTTGRGKTQTQTALIAFSQACSSIEPAAPVDRRRRGERAIVGLCPGSQAPQSRR